MNKEKKSNLMKLSRLSLFLSIICLYESTCFIDTTYVACLIFRISSLVLLVAWYFSQLFLDDF